MNKKNILLCLICYLSLSKIQNIEAQSKKEPTNNLVEPTVLDQKKPTKAVGSEALGEQQKQELVIYKELQHTSHRGFCAGLCTCLALKMGAILSFFNGANPFLQTVYQDKRGR